MGSNHNTRSFLRLIPFATILTVVLLLLAHGPNVFAQVDQGSITGIVTDPSGAVVPNAKVTLLNTDQGLTLETTTTGAGEYTFSPVRIGHYTITVSAAGFATTAQQNLTVNVSQNLRVNVQLKPGSATQTVEVTAAPPQLQTEDASTGQVITGQSVNNLPLNGRNFTFLAQLSAGVNTPQADTRGNAASGAFTANGLRPAQNNYLLDGIDNNSDNVDFLNGTNFVVLPPPDALSEFKVQTSDYSAELGRAAGAVLNATIKSGTNEIHGTVWEFFRNDVLDAADWFENNAGIKKGELRWNQFGGSIGGPIIKNKIFYFGDYQGFRHVQGNTQTGSVPTALQRSSGYTNLSEILTANSSNASRTDALGRSIPYGTVLDPATTRNLGNGQWVRDPFGLSTCSGSTISLANCPGLNQIPTNRIDPNAVALLNLFPAPTNGSVYSNFASSPKLTQFANQFDIRGDFNMSEKDQVFARVSYWDNPQYIPGPFGGVADGGGFQTGNQPAKSFQGVAVWTHVFSPSTVNVVHFGWDHLHTSRLGPAGNTLGVPEQYGIQGIPQVPLNGGLPQFTFGGLANLGSSAFLPSDETTQTTQVTDDFSKVYQAHSFKMGIEFQRVEFNTLQPSWSRGTDDYNGSFTDIPGNNSSTLGIAQFVLPPVQGAPVTNTDGTSFTPYYGGADDIRASNIGKTYDLKKYFAAYFQDDWKVNPKLTLNLGLRYDYFGPINETNGGQANFVPSGPPNGGPVFIIPASGKANRQVSSAFLAQLAKDGIAYEPTNKYGQGLVQVQKDNFAPRFGFAYQAMPKLVIRGGGGYFYNSFENQGYGPNIGENYPFQFSFNYPVNTPPGAPSGYNTVAPASYNTAYPGCATAAPSGNATFEAQFSCTEFNPTAVTNASGLGLQGMQFKFITPRTLAANLAVQYAITPTMSAQVAYVFTQASRLQINLGANNVTALIGQNLGSSVVGSPGIGGTSPFPDFGGGSWAQTRGASVYNGLQMKLEQQFSNGLNYLLTYTWSKTMTDASDLLNGGGLANFPRAPNVPGFGLAGDWSPAPFDIRNVFHFSGGYELPFGKGKHYGANVSKAANYVIGDWAINWIVTSQGGQPLTLTCPSGTTSGTNCYDVTVPGESRKLGIKVRPNGSGLLTPYWFNNPAAFNQPCQTYQATYGAPLTFSLTPGAPPTPAGCVPLTGFAALGNRGTNVEGPHFNRFDFSTFKNFPITERFNLQFRAEFFNIINHPNFNAPGFGGNGVPSFSGATNFTNTNNFGAIGSTRDAPYDPRQIQFALKLYY